MVRKIRNIVEAALPGELVKEGDNNSKFFHGKASNHRRRNRLIALKTESKEWLKDLNLTSMLFHTSKTYSRPILSMAPWNSYLRCETSDY